MKKIPFSRVLVYLIMLGLIPLFTVCFFYIKEKNSWSAVAEHIEMTSHQGQMKSSRQSINNLVRKKHEDADNLYIEKLEALTFLNKEKEALEALFASRSFTGNENAELRYAFLCGKENVLHFTDKDAQKADKISETLETLAHSVEIDHADLRKILSLIEESSSHQPQMIITDFKLSKKAKADGNQVFELNCALIKREFEK